MTSVATMIFVLLLMVAFVFRTTRGASAAKRGGFLAIVLLLSVPTLLTSYLMGARAKGQSVGGDMLLLGGGVALIMVGAVTWPHLARRLLTVPRMVERQVLKLGFERMSEGWRQVFQWNLPVRFAGEYEGWPTGYEIGPGAAMAVDSDGRASSARALWGSKNGTLWAGDGLQGPVLAILPRDFPATDLVGVDLPQAEVAVGDEAFQSRFVVWCSAEEWAQKVVDGPLQRRLMQAPIPPVLLFRNGHVCNLVTNDALLIGSSGPLDVALELAKRISETSP